MKRNWKLLLCLLLAAATLSACSGGGTPNEVFPEVTQNLGPVTATATPVASQPQQPDADMQPSGDIGGQSIFDANPYDVLEPDFTPEDALKEENYIDPDEDLYVADINATVYPYAGSTPIPLNPVDMPTPTPRPALSFTYGTYTSASIGVSFEAPVGWQVDESQSQVMVLSEPEGQIKDGQQCVITLSAEPVTGNYSESDLKTQVNQRLDTIGGAEFDEWKPSYTATRYMMGSKGVYANYTGTLTSGVNVGGRILYVCIDRVLYGLEIVFPQGFKDDYLDVFGKIRSSMKTN